MRPHNLENTESSSFKTIIVRIFNFDCKIQVPYRISWFCGFLKRAKMSGFGSSFAIYEITGKSVISVYVSSSETSEMILLTSQLWGFNVKCLYQCMTQWLNKYCWSIRHSSRLVFIYLLNSAVLNVGLNLWVWIYFDFW